MSVITSGMCLFLTPASNRITHLYIVITEPDGDPSSVALVNITSADIGDRTVILEVGDHSFITKRSYVNYAQATVQTIAKLQSIMDADITVRHREDASPELLKKVRDGVQASPHSTPKFQRYCQGKF